MTTTSLKVVFANPDSHYVDFSIDLDGQGVSESISCIFPIFQDFCTVLAAAAEGIETRPIVLCAEPVEFELHFLPDRDAGAARLVVQEWPDSARSSLETPKTVVAMEGSRLEVVAPFWRALRRLQASMPRDLPDGYWKHEFPDDGLEKLTRSIEALKSRAAAK